MKAASVGAAIVVGTDIVTSEAALEIAERNPNLFAAVGLHPTDVPIRGDLSNQSVPYRPYLAHQEVVAIGEVGFDFHYTEDKDLEVAKSAQWHVLTQFVELANETNRPIIIHCRDAADDLVDFLGQNAISAGAVAHCFDGSYEFARALLDFGHYISLTAMITYPKNDALREVVKKLPPDRVLTETDCPFLPPQDLRGQRNEPMYVAEVVRQLAELWQMPMDAVDQITTKNAKDLFKI